MAEITNFKDAKKIVMVSLSVILLIAVITCAVVLFGFNQSVEAQTSVLKKGSSGQQVKQVQQKLNSLGFNCGEADGIFGSKTYEAVRKFQSSKGLSVDGIVGEKTASALGLTLSSGSSSNSGYSSSDIYLLAKCIHAEARGEPYTGQVAVGAVILNRVRSSDFPNSISGVIYQPYAFTAVNDGQMNLEPNDSAFRAARDAINGWDPSNGCLYYFNPSTATSKWIWSRTIKLTIGKHNFCV